MELNSKTLAGELRPAFYVSHSRRKYTESRSVMAAHQVVKMPQLLPPAVFLCTASALAMAGSRHRFPSVFFRGQPLFVLRLSGFRRRSGVFLRGPGFLAFASFRGRLAVR